jgi:predicted MFS family arabinose efflux permease
LIRAVRRNRQGWFLLTIAFGWFITLGARFLLPAILPQIKATFGIDNSTAGFAITIVWLGYGLMQFPAGILVDRFDERRILTLSLVLAGASLGLIGVAPVFGVFVASAGLFGLATGLFGTSRGIALSEYFPDRPGRAFGITLAAGSIGSAAFPLFGSVATESVGWRIAVALSAPLFGLTALSTMRNVPGRAAEPAPPSDEPTVGVAEALRAGLSNSTVVVGILGMMMMLFTYQALTAFLPTYLIQEKALSQWLANAMFGLLFVAAAAFQIGLSSAADRFGTRPVILLISGVGVVTLAALPLVGGVVPLFVLIVVMSSRLAAVPVMNQYIIAALPDHATGTTWGLLRSVLFVVGSTGSTVVGVLSDADLFDGAFSCWPG